MSSPAPARTRHRRARLSVAVADPARVRSIAVESAVVLAGFALLAIVATWPLVREFGTLITAPVPGNDQLGYLFDFRYAAENGLPVIHDYLQREVAVPFGRPASAAANLTLLGTLAPAVVITDLAGPIVAYNVITLAGLTLSGAAMYLLVRWLGLGRGPAVWAGAVYLLFPYHLLAATAFVTVVQYQVLPLVLMALVAWATRPGWASGAGVVASVAAAWLTFPYFGAMAMVMLVVGLAVALGMQTTRDGIAAAARRLGALAAGVAVCVALPLAIVTAINSGGATGNLTRSPDELAVLGAELSDYVVPPQSSAFMAGLVGVEDWFPLGSPGGERLTFIGWVTALLALAGLGAGVAMWRRLPDRQAALLAIAVPMIVVLVALSLRSPYDVAGSEVTFPSRMLFEVFDFVRAPGRFVIAVMVGVVAIGALALHLLGNRMGTVGRHALVAGAIVFSAAELGLGLPLPVTAPTQLGDRPAEQQPSWRWLADHPGGAVMEYPEVGNTAVSRYYMYGWVVHRHPIVNAVHGQGDPGGEFTRTVIDPRPPGTAAILAGAGVRHVVLNRWAYDALQLPQPARLPDGFTRVARFGDGSELWRVDAAPSAGQVYFTAQGFDGHRLEHDGERLRNWRTLIGPGAGVVRVRVDRAGRYLARFRAAPTGAPVTLSFAVDGGPARRVRVEGLGPVAVPLDLPAGTSDVSVSAEGVPEGPSAQMTPWILERAR